MESIVNFKSAVYFEKYSRESRLVYTTRDV